MLTGSVYLCHIAYAAAGLIESLPEIRLGMERWSSCHEKASCAGPVRPRPARSAR